MAKSLNEIYKGKALVTNKLFDPEQDQQELNRAGIIGDLFKFLGRTSGASAEAAYALTDKDPNTTVLQGIKEGLLGRADVSYKDVLEDNLGIKNRVVSSVGGFVGDVALDPLSYIGAKRIKGTSKPEAILQAIKAGSDDVDTAAAQIMAASPTRIGLTVSGTPFGRGRTVGSLKLPNLGQRQATEALLGPVENRRLGPRLFSREAELPLGLSESGRVIENSHNAAFGNFRRQMQSLYDGLDPEEREQIAQALDRGESLTSAPVSNMDTTKFKTQGEYAKASKKILDDMFVEEGKLGLFTLKPGKSGNLPTDYVEYNPNYVYRYYRKPPVDALSDGEVAIPNSIAGSERSGFQKKRTADVTLQEAKDLGWEPITDIGEIMDMRAGKHFRSMAAGSQVRDAINQFGITGEELSKLGSQSSVKSLGWVPAERMAGPVAQNLGKGKYVPEFVAKAMNQAWDTYKGQTTGAQAVKLHDKIMRNWKWGNTAIMPGYHVRNSFGDLILNMADGVTSPHRYNQAFKVLNDRRHINERALGEMVDLDIAAGTKQIKLGGQKISTDKVFDLYGMSGAKSGLITSEVQRSMSDFERLAVHRGLSKFKSKIGDWSDTREDFFRLAHFIDATDEVLKSKAGRKLTLEQAAMEAGKRVRKFNIDYGNLSSFERNVMNRIVPFYSWMRRSTPLNMELLFTKPGFMALYPKGQDLLQGLLGTDTAEGEQLIPEWIREMAPVRIALGKEEDRNFLQSLVAKASGLGNNESAFLNFAGEAGGLTPIGTAGIPLGIAAGVANGSPSDALQAAANPLQGGLTPLIKLPIELGTGRSLFTGQDINPAQTLISNITGGPGRAVAANQGAGTSILNNVLGLGIQRATAGRQESEFRRRQDSVSATSKRVKESLLSQRFPDWGKFSEAKKEELRKRISLPKTDEEVRLQRQRRYLTQILGQ